MVSVADFSKGEGLVRTYELFEHLLDDVYKSFEVLESDKQSQYLRRATVRTVFAFIESVVHILKYEIKSDIRMNRYSYSLTDKEMEILHEEKQRNGETIQFFIPVDENIKKTFALASRIWGLPSYILNTNSENYSSFLRAKSSRNKITHPRTFYDINITDSEMSDFAAAFLWIKSEFNLIMQMKVESISSELPRDIYERLLKS